MPEERTDNGKQQTFGEDYEPIRNRKVTGRATKYSKALTERMAWQEQENVRRAELIEAMDEEEVPVVIIDGYKLELVDDHKMKIKRTKLEEEA